MLATNGFDTFATFLYADGLIQWTSSDDSGGVNGLGGNAARVGYNSQDGSNYFTISESGTAAIINITQTSNINIPGIWMFRVSDQGEVLDRNYAKICV